KQRDEHARAPPAHVALMAAKRRKGRSHASIDAHTDCTSCEDGQSKRRSIRAMPSANTANGGSRLTTRNDSRGKSKKYPGSASTPSAVSRDTTRSSSGSSVGTCSTAYHPPSLR